MKIIHWNCQGAFRKKKEALDFFKADILVISECESPQRLKYGKLIPKPTAHFWYGDSEHKGIAVFSYSSYKIEPLPVFNPKFRYIVPLLISNENEQFHLFAIWAMDDKKDRKSSYIGQVWKALEYYQKLLSESCILVGDFNSNQIWDKQSRVGNHTDVVNKLAENGIKSLYHDKYKEVHGQESEATFYLHRNKNKPYHMDYCFVSETLLKNGHKFSVGSFEKWIPFSDHSPLFIDLL